MFQDPNHPDVQQLAAHHDAGTHATIPPEQAADAVQAFHQQADPQMVQQVTDEHYEQMTAAQLQATAQQFHDKIATVATSSPEAAQLARIDPASATPQQVSAMHRFLSTQHPELMRDVLLAGGAIAVGALAAFAARRYLRSHGR
ncbi:MAG: hypothetical protein IVW57_05810 [Ktedonobacterales bacterium]|nr:hypothetical protein [Ktedonobacterales bacterium]